MKTIINFFGPDGSGKTTLVNNITNLLPNDRVRVIWFRGSHTIASVLARFISRFQLFKGSDNPYYNISIPDSMKGLWRFIEFISFLPILIFKIILPSILGYILICERSIPDFIAWIILTLRDPGFLNTWMAKFLLGYTFKASNRFYVTASLDILKSRRPDMDDSIIRRQIVIYEKLSRFLDAYRIDTTDKGVEESIGEILGYIGNDSPIRV